MDISPLGPNPNYPQDPKQQQSIDRFNKHSRVIVQDIDSFVEQTADPNVQVKQLTDTFKTQVANGLMLLQKHAADIPDVHHKVIEIQSFYEQNILYEHDITDVVQSAGILRGMIIEAQASLPM